MIHCYWYEAWRRNDAWRQSLLPVKQLRSYLLIKKNNNKRVHFYPFIAIFNVVECHENLCLLSFFGPTECIYGELHESGNLINKKLTDIIINNTARKL